MLTGVRRVSATALIFSLFLIPLMGAQKSRSASSPDQSGLLGQGRLVIHDVPEGPPHSRMLRPYWSPARMKAAVPAALPMREGAMIGSMSHTAAGEGGVPRLVPPTEAGASRMPAWRRSMAAVSGGIPFSRFEVTDTVSPPARTHGTIYYSDSTGDYACSGTAVTSPTESAVFTAGHCVHDQTGGWAEQMVFVPGYRNGSTPYGVFPAHTLAAVTPWTQNQNHNYDYGGVLVGTNSAGTSLQLAVGARGIAFNQPREQTFQAWGYPGEPPFDGERSFVCESAYGGDDPFPDPGPSAMGIGCDMTRGASGGGWVIGGEYVNSVSSFGYPSYPNVLFGPYFGDGAKTVYDSICCDPADKPPGGSTPPPPPNPQLPPPGPSKPAPAAKPPNTTLTWHPARRTVSRRAVFRFRSSVAGSWFKCLFATGWRRCSSPEIFRGLAPGFYIFKVRAINNGLQDPTPAVWHYRVLRLR